MIDNANISMQDMAARYQDNRTVGQSLYNADFDGDKVKHSFPSELVNIHTYIHTYIHVHTCMHDNINHLYITVLW